MLKIVLLDENLMETFWHHVNQNQVDYHFFIFDVKNNPDKTKVWLALEGENVVGMLLVYRDCIVQLRGSHDVVKALLEKIDLREVELQAPLDCEDLVLAKFIPKMKHRMIQMTLKRGEERNQITTEPESLDVGNAEEMVELLRRAFPDWWSDADVERFRSTMTELVNMGIRHDGKLVSVGIARLTGYASNINTVATDERYRNRGYATSIVCTLAKKILENSEVAMIHVLEDNAPAVKAYTKAGYKPHETYLLIRT